MKKQTLTTARQWQKYAGRSLAALSALLALQTALAQDALMQNAQGLLANKQAVQAYQLLVSQEAARAGQPEFDYLLGVSALEAGRITQAIFALERVLAVQPGNNLVRAELARAYIASGETDTAKLQLQQVKAATDVPREARESVERLLSSLDKAPSKPLNFYVEAGLGHDSNLSGGPNISGFAVPALGGAVFALAPASQQRGDSTLQLGAGLAYTHALGAATDLSTQLNWRATRPFKENTLDISSIDGSLGIAHSVAATRYSVALHLASLSFDGNSYRRTTGLTGQIVHKINSNSNSNSTSQLMGFVQLARLDYPSAALRDARRTLLGGAWGTALSPATSVYAGLALGGEKASQAAGAEFGYTLTGLRAGAEHALSNQIRLFANLGLEWRKHRAIDSVFLSKRHDRQSDLTFGMHYQLSPTSDGQWRITPQLNWTQRSSNFTVYEMRRSQIGVAARFDF